MFERQQFFQFQLLQGGEELLAALGNVGALLKSGEDEVKVRVPKNSNQFVVDCRSLTHSLFLICCIFRFVSLILYF